MILFIVAAGFLSACKKGPTKKLVIGSKFFTEQVMLAELLAQHIEQRTVRKRVMA